MLLLYYIYNQKHINATLEEKWLTSLPDEKASQIRRMRIPQKRHLSLIGLQLLDYGARQLQLTDFSLRKVQFPAKDKPVCDQCDFSISHSRDLVICAISENHNIGIDAEFIRPINPTIFKRHLTEQERQLSEDNMPQFFEFWTRKEAIVKAANSGGIKSIPAVQLAQGYGTLLGKTWYTQKVEILPNYVVYLATDRQDHEYQCDQIDILQLSE